jgi:hypothetical protein
MAMTEQKRKPWKTPVVKSTVVVAPLGLVCLSSQVTCTLDGNVCAPSCDQCPSLTC